jgi:hypothetical protein
MSQYVRYERIQSIFDEDMLREKLKIIVENGWDIIHYDEKIKDENKFQVLILCGVPNKGKKKIL